MPLSGLNVGVDYSVSFYESSSGSLIDLGDVQSIRITAQKHDISSKPYNRLPRYGYIDDGFKIDFTITRTSPILENLAVLQSINLNNGVVQSPGYLNETVTNPDGTVSRYQYTNFVAFLTDHGDISREKVVSLRLEGMASAKVQIA